MYVLFLIFSTIFLQNETFMDLDLVKELKIKTKPLLSTKLDLVLTG